VDQQYRIKQLAITKPTPTRTTKLRQLRGGAGGACAASPPGAPPSGRGGLRGGRRGGSTPLLSLLLPVGLSLRWG
jgi:hypothetical protein